jgi:fibronectin-binding autotransporter adhesin
MANRNRRFTVAAVALPLLLVATTGMARAATLFVTNTNDSGSGSLRAEIAAASPGDTINFMVTGTISLMSTLSVATSLTITGPTGSPGITIDGGGSVEVMEENSGITVTLQNLTIAHGSSSFGDGGGVFNSAGTLTVSKCTFSDNSAVTGGGGIDNFGGAVTVTNSTFSGNNADLFGGGILNEEGGILTVTNSTFFDNSAPSGGGIDNAAGSATLKGAILADKSNDGNCTGTITDDGFNIADDGSCGFTEASSGGSSINNSTTLNLDPLGLQNNGGPTQTIALEPTSEAVDFIPVAHCTDQSSPTPLPLTTDQRGFPRPDPANLNFCDAGAYELTTPVAVTLKIKPKSLKFPKTTVGTPSKSETVTVSNPKGKKKHPGLPVVIEMVSDAGPGVFMQTNDCPMIPATLAADSFCTIMLTFTPSAAMKQTGTLTITDNANGRMQTVRLSGTGK